jgi:hypothetical protein
MSIMADIWDDQHTHAASGSTSIKPKKRSKNFVVPEDWELDEEEEEDAGRSVDLPNKQLWEDANAKVHHPMPSLVISRGTSTSVTLPSLPLNQTPQMRILKRPSPSSSSTVPTNSGGAAGETLKEREARYHAARERIFGASPDEEQDNDDTNKFARKVVESSPLPAASVRLVREPRGPDGNNFDTKGFGERRASRPSATTISSPTANPS